MIDDQFLDDQLLADLVVDDLTIESTMIDDQTIINIDDAQQWSINTWLTMII